MTSQPSKICTVCGRRFSWRAKWARDWPNVRYCSKRCRGRGLKAVDHLLEAAIESLLSERGGSSICPSEAAKRVSASGWRELMEPCRMAARRLHYEGRVRIMQRGHTIDPDDMRGPVRLAPPRS